MRIIIIFLILFNLSSANAEKISINPNVIFKNLRCLVCQGQSVGDSNSEFAQTIKLIVKDQIKEGKSEIIKAVIKVKKLIITNVI